jgi:hypothetical protein
LLKSCMRINHQVWGSVSAHRRVGVSAFEKGNQLRRTRRSL